MSECQVAISRPSQPTSEFLETLNTKDSQGLGQCAAFMRHTSKFTCTLISLHKPQGQTLRIRSHLQVNQYRHLLKTTSYYQMFNCLCSKYVSQVISYSNFSKAEKHAQVFGDFCFVLFATSGQMLHSLKSSCHWALWNNPNKTEGERKVFNKTILYCCNIILNSTCSLKKKITAVCHKKAPTRYKMVSDQQCLQAYIAVILSDSGVRQFLPNRLLNHS